MKLPILAALAAAAALVAPGAAMAAPPASIIAPGPVSPAGTAGGDLVGSSYPAPVVSGLSGVTNGERIIGGVSAHDHASQLEIGGTSVDTDPTVGARAIGITTVFAPQFETATSDAIIINTALGNAAFAQQNYEGILINGNIRTDYNFTSTPPLQGIEVNIWTDNRTNNPTPPQILESFEADGLNILGAGGIANATAGTYNLDEFYAKANGDAVAPAGVIVNYNKLRADLTNSSANVGTMFENGLLVHGPCPTGGTMLCYGIYVDNAGAPVYFAGAVQAAGLTASATVCADLLKTLTGACPNAVTLANEVQAPANTVRSNPTGSTANVQDQAVPSCSAASSSLQYITSTGFGCGQAQLKTSVFASLPSAASNTGVQYLVTDVGVGEGSIWASDGTNWDPVGQITLCESSVSASHTGDTTETVAETCTVAANILGTNRTLAVRWIASNTADAAVAKVRVRFGGSGITGTLFQAVSATSTSVSAACEVMISNRNSSASQVAATATACGPATAVAAVSTGTVGTSVSQPLVVTVQGGAGGDTTTIEQYKVVLQP